jgi:hypothetical protein
MIFDPRIPRARKRIGSRAKSRPAIQAAELKEIKDSYSALRELGVSRYSATSFKRRMKLMVSCGYGYKDGYWIKGLRRKLKMLGVDARDAAILQHHHLKDHIKVIYDTEKDFDSFELRCAPDPQKREALMNYLGYVRTTRGHEDCFIAEIKTALTKFMV